MEHTRGRAAVCRTLRDIRLTVPAIGHWSWRSVVRDKTCEISDRRKIMLYNCGMIVFTFTQQAQQYLPPPQRTPKNTSNPKPSMLLRQESGMVVIVITAASSHLRGCVWFLCQGPQGLHQGCIERSCARREVSCVYVTLPNAVIANRLRKCLAVMQVKHLTTMRRIYGLVHGRYMRYATLR